MQRFSGSWIAASTAAMVVATAVLASWPALPAAASANARPRVNDRRTPPLRTVPSLFAEIKAGRDKCREADSPLMLHLKLEDCDGKAIDAYEALIPRTHNKERVKALMRDMIGPLVFVLTPGEVEHVALLADTMVVYSYADMEGERAAILRGAAPDTRPGKARKTRPVFYWVNSTPGLARWLLNMGQGRHVAQSFQRQWEAIRNDDCKAYPVPRCRERLDNAMRRMFVEIEKSKLE